MNVLWFIPTHGDGRDLGTSIGGRAITPEYLRQLAGAIDSLGYYGALLPTGKSCEDAWITTASLIPVTNRFAELVFPKLFLDNVPQLAPSRYLSPIGEIVVNEKLPVSSS